MSQRRASPLWVDVDELGPLVRALRRHRRLTQQDLGARADLDATTITKLEGGKRRPRIENVERIAGVFGLTAEALLDAARRWGALKERSDRERLERELLSRAKGAATAPPDGLRVANLPPGTVAHVAVDAVGQDEHGVWIDQLAPVLADADPERHPRIERYGDGTIVLDDSRLEKPAVGGRDPARHTTRISRRYDDAPPSDISPGLAEAYAATILRITWADGDVSIVEPIERGRTVGDHPAGGTVHVITAYNPRSRLTRPEENRERDRLLHADLVELGLDPVRATGSAPDTTWSEDGWAVVAADEAAVLNLARKYEQSAIFRWTPDALEVVWTSDRQPDVHGWQLR